MKKLFIVTTTFPFGSKEPFIENEIEYYSAFDEVYFLPIYAEGDVRDIVFPKNVRWIKVNRYKKWQLLREMPKIPFLSVFYDELAVLFKNKKLSLRSIYDLFIMLVLAHYYSSQILKIIKPLTEGSKNFFYSYWMVEHAIIGILLSKDINFQYMFTRAHGYDLYATRRKSGYLPCRNYILDNMSMVCPISEDGVNYLKDNIHYNIELSRLGTKDYGLAPFSMKNRHEITIVSCSWCVEVKRIDLIIRSLSKINEVKVNWIHIGDGPLLESLKSLAKDLLGSNVKWNLVGRKTNKDVIDFYKKTNVDFFINVSSSEGIPVSIMEAISFGVPVIATGVGGTPEIVKNGENGFLLKPDLEDDDIKKYIVEYSKMNEGEIMTLRRNARSLWKQNYSASVNYSSFFKKISNL